MMTSQLRNYRLWLRGLLAAVIGGVSNAVLATLGITGAQMAGAPIASLDLKQLGAVAASAALISAAFYLKQSPLPKFEEDQP